MEFHHYVEAFSYMMKRGDISNNSNRDAFYKYFADQAVLNDDTFGYRQATMELMWIKNNRPYYNVWPDIIPMLIKLDLEKVDSIHCTPPAPVNPILVRFPKKNNPLSFEAHGKIWSAQCIMLGFMSVKERPGGEQTHGICIGIDVGERVPLPTTNSTVSDPGFPIHEYRIFPRIEGRTIYQVIKDTCTVKSRWSEQGLQTPDALLDDITKLCCTLCLLSDDPEIIEPEILSKDEGRYNGADDGRKLELVARAKRRGKFGWSVGKKIQSCPHYRRPHPVLVWTGKGRQIPKIVMRKGTIVHRKKLTKVPTGYAGKGEAPKYESKDENV